jgi:hypothetical protein
MLTSRLFKINVYVLLYDSNNYNVNLNRREKLILYCDFSIFQAAEYMNYWVGIFLVLGHISVSLCIMLSSIIITKFKPLVKIISVCNNTLEKIKSRRKLYWGLQKPQKSWEEKHELKLIESYCNRFKWVREGVAGDDGWGDLTKV